MDIGLEIGGDGVPAGEPVRGWRAGGGPKEEGSRREDMGRATWLRWVCPND